MCVWFQFCNGSSFICREIICASPIHWSNSWRSLLIRPLVVICMLFQAGSQIYWAVNGKCAVLLFLKWSMSFNIIWFACRSFLRSSMFVFISFGINVRPLSNRTCAAVSMISVDRLSTLAQDPQERSISVCGCVWWSALRCWDLWGIKSSYESKCLHQKTRRPSRPCLWEWVS